MENLLDNYSDLALEVWAHYYAKRIGDDEYANKTFWLVAELDTMLKWGMKITAKVERERCNLEYDESDVHNGTNLEGEYTVLQLTCNNQTISLRTSSRVYNVNVHNTIQTLVNLINNKEI